VRPSPTQPTPCTASPRTVITLWCQRPDSFQIAAIRLGTSRPSHRLFTFGGGIFRFAGVVGEYFVSLRLKLLDHFCQGVTCRQAGRVEHPPAVGAAPALDLHFPKQYTIHAEQYSLFPRRTINFIDMMCVRGMQSNPNPTFCPLDGAQRSDHVISPASELRRDVRGVCAGIWKSGLVLMKPGRRANPAGRGGRVSVSQWTRTLSEIADNLKRLLRL
jgi:hypothetical protein